MGKPKLHHPGKKANGHGGDFIEHNRSGIFPTEHLFRYAAKPDREQGTGDNSRQEKPEISRAQEEDELEQTRNGAECSRRHRDATNPEALSDPKRKPLHVELHVLQIEVSVAPEVKRA